MECVIEGDTMNKKFSGTINRNWTTRDVLVTAIFSLIIGVIFIPMAYLGSLLGSFSFIKVIYNGICFWPIIMVTYLMRKPGVALYSAAVTFLVPMIATPMGIMMLIHILTVRLPIEVVFLATNYKKFELRYLMLAGALCGF